MEKGTISKKYNINNKKKSKNINNNGNIENNIRFSMAKTMIIVIMEKSGIITILTVIMTTYRQDGEKQKQNKTEIDLKIGQVNTNRNIFLLLTSKTLKPNIKNYYLYFICTKST